MNLLGRILIMAVCVFTAYAWPNFSDVQVAQENRLLKAVIDQLQTSVNLFNPLAANTTNNTQNACYSTYNSRVAQINNATINQTQACSTTANNAISAQNANINKTLVAVNLVSKDLQARLANCSSRNTSAAVFDCNVAAFDLNLANLSNITAQSQLASASLSGYEIEVNASRQACIGNVLIANKSNSTSASNDLQNCLVNSEWKNNSTGSSNSTNPGGNKTMIYYLD